MQREKPSAYSDLIQDATSAPGHLLPLLEKLMREEVCQTPLAGLSREDFAAAAREAHDLYRSAPLYYEGVMIVHRAAARHFKLEIAIRKASERKTDPDHLAELRARETRARESFENAREALSRLADFYSLP